MKLYLMRHGLTVWNEKGRSQGHSQNRLSSTGKKQIEEKAKDYSGVKFDIIYASPLMRTMQTANIMNKYHNVKIIKNDLLIEIDRGIFAGKYFKDLSEEEKVLFKSTDASCKMESYQQVFDRAKLFVDFLKHECRYDNVLIVTHARVASFITHILTGTKLDLNDKKSFISYFNAEIKEFII